MSSLSKQLDIKAGVMEMGERIAFGSDTALMREASVALEIHEENEALWRSKLHEAQDEAIKLQHENRALRAQIATLTLTP